MSRLPRVLVLGALALAGVSAGVLAHVRLRNPSTGNALFWASPGSVGIVISSAGSDNVADSSHLTALRNAIAAWNEVGDSGFQLVEDASPAEQARTDWEADDLHMILFDEDDSSGLFPVGSGIVAITPVWFQGSGQIVDADVLFNGASYQFTTSGFSQRFDVQDVATHELGHLAGLDHSGWAGATMYPYVDPSVILHRSPSADDVHGLREAYPGDGPYSTIVGTVAREANGQPVSGAHVVACDENGRTAGGTLTNPNGAFALTALSAGTYTLYARPLDEPVSAANFSSPWTVHTDFSPAFLPVPVVLASGETRNAGSISVGADSPLNLGKNIDDYPIRVVPGIQVVTVRGKNLLAGSTVACSDSSIVLKPVEWKGSWLQTRVNVPVGAAPGHVDLIVTASDGSMSILTAGLEITPADPVVTTVTPGLGPKAGGSSMTLHGAGFRPGARVVVGDQIYVDGQPGGCTVVDETTISLITRATAPGTHDAVVIDATGVEGRAPDAFTSAAVPVLSGLFPPSGALDGGTSLVLNGVDFAPGIVVRIGGVAQTGVVFDSPLRVRLTTGAATLPGPYDLEIENPGGAQAQGVFVYWDQPDPALDAIAPESGDPAGGETVTLHGANFTPTTAVVFGADPDTGEGGLPAPSVVFVDSETLVVVTPAFGAGSAAVLVQDEDTGQGSVAPQAFEFVSRGGGGGGGGCGSLAPPAPPTWRDALAGTWLLAALFAWLALRAARARPRHARA